MAKNSIDLDALVRVTNLIRYAPTNLDVLSEEELNEYCSLVDKSNITLPSIYYTPWEEYVFLKQDAELLIGMAWEIYQESSASGVCHDYEMGLMYKIGMRFLDRELMEKAAEKLSEITGLPAERILQLYLPSERQEEEYLKSNICTG